MTEKDVRADMSEDSGTAMTYAVGMADAVKEFLLVVGMLTDQIRAMD